MCYIHAKVRAGNNGGRRLWCHEQVKVRMHCGGHGYIKQSQWRTKWEWQGQICQETSNIWQSCAIWVHAKPQEPVLWTIGNSKFTPLMTTVNIKYISLMTIVNYQICPSNDNGEYETRQTKGHLLSPGTDSDSMSNRGDNEQVPERADQGRRCVQEFLYLATPTMWLDVLFSDALLQFSYSANSRVDNA